MDKRTKTWLSILGALLAVCVMAGIAAIGGSIYFVYSHVRREPAETTEAAGDRFEQMRQKLGGRKPLLEIRDRDDVVVHHSEIPIAGNAPRVQTLRALIYDPREGRILDVDVPFWLLRLLPSGRFSFMNDAGIDFNSDRIKLTVDDLEKNGPGPILDHRDRRGAEILVWTE